MTVAPSSSFGCTKVLSKYPVDGLELNLRSGADHQFTGHFFHPNHIAEGAEP